MLMSWLFWLLCVGETFQKYIELKSNLGVGCTAEAHEKGVCVSYLKILFQYLRGGLRMRAEGTVMNTHTTTNRVQNYK